MPAAAAAAPAAAPEAPRVVEPRVAAAAGPNIRFSGDLRYRHEAINEEGEAERHRQRIRARFGVTADVAENVRVGLTLATGGDDPVSANQTLDTGFSRKPIGVDRAFFSWAATEQLTFTGGKMANPFYRPGNHHLIYDNDLNPEGLALRYSRGDWFANYAGLWVEERGADDDSIMLGGQFGYRHTLADGMRITAGAGYYDYLETQGRTPFWDGAARRQSRRCGGQLLERLQSCPAVRRAQPAGRRAAAHGVRGLRRQYARPMRPTPALRSARASARSRAPARGASATRIRISRRTPSSRTFTDSDWAGGGTDGTGHVVEFNYGFRERLVFGFRYFLNERGADVGNEHDYNRLQADVQFNY